MTSQNLLRVISLRNSDLSGEELLVLMHCSYWGIYDHTVHVSELNKAESEE